MTNPSYPFRAPQARAKKNRSRRLRVGLTTTLLLPALSISSPVWAMPGSESWYMNRARSNMEIGNYKAAIEAYEKVVDQDPDNREAMRSLGIAYENQGLKDKAVEQYDKYLAKNPDDADIAFRQAEALQWSRYSYRKSDALKYYQMGLARKNNTQMRLKYARLLASNQETSGEAIRQYQTVLKSQPGNAEAHRGLAKAYAWNGKNDLALYHAELAQQRGASTQDLVRLENDLNRGREPALSADFEFINQPGDHYGLTGIQFFGLGRKDLSPFLTGNLKAGLENYSHDSESATGGVLSAGLEYRPDESQKISGTLEYHSLRPITGNQSTSSESGLSHLVGKGEYQYTGDGYSIAPGFERTIRGDSLLSIAGSQVVGTGLGAARSNAIYTQFAFNANDFDFRVKPYAGWVSALTVPSNGMIGIDGSVEHGLIDGRSFQLKAAHVMQLSHYGKDQSALTGDGAGYFSPQFFMNQSPRLRGAFSLGDKQSLEASAGPAIQYLRDDAVPGGWQLGAEADLGYTAKFTRRLSWKIQGGYANVADAYSRVQVGNVLTYLF